mgnify:CR=1 FL=1
MAAAATYERSRRRTTGMVNGSLAYDFGTLERQLDDTGRMDPDLYTPSLEETSADVISRAHAHAKAKVRPAQHLSPVMVLGAAAVAVLMVLVVLSYVELATISNSVVSMRSQVAELETRQVTLLTQYEQAFDLVSVKEQALAAGMSLPSDSQVYYIDLSDPDNAVVYEQDSQGAAQVLEQIWQTILHAVEYFR